MLNGILKKENLNQEDSSTNVTIDTNEDTNEDTTEVLEDELDFENVIIKKIGITFVEVSVSKKNFKPAIEVLKIDKKKQATFYKFFSDHLTHTKKGKKSRSCRFIDSDANIISKINTYYEGNCDKNTQDEKFLDFVNKTGQLFFDKFSTTSSKSDGSLFIIEASIPYLSNTDNKKNFQDVLLLLKIDPRQGVQLKMKEATSGDSDDTIFELEAIANMLPHDENSIHKSAIIYIDLDDDNKYVYKNDEGTHIIALDSQRSGEPSKFFINDFLDAKLIPNDSKKTDEAMKIMLENFNTQLEKLNATQKYNDRVRDAIDKVFIKEQTRTIDSLAEEVLKKVVDYDDKKDVYSIINTEGEKVELNHSEIINSYVKTYTSKDKDFTTTITIQRNSDTVVYDGVFDSKKVKLTFDRSLENKNVFINNEDPQKIIITIVDQNADSTNSTPFKKSL